MQLLNEPLNIKLETRDCIIFVRNASSTLSCLEKLNCRSSNFYQSWYLSIGQAEADVYLCDNNDLREGK